MSVKVIEGLAIYAFGKTYKVSVHATTYPAGGRLALQLMTPMEQAPDIEEPFATLTVNLPEHELPEGQVFIKDYAENEGFADWAAEAGIIEPQSEGFVHSGFVTIHRYRLTQAFLNALAECLAGAAPRKVMS